MSVDDLEAYGAERMDDDAIRQFLTTQGVGVLGLPADDGPYLLPLSFGYDGADRLYFTYVVGTGSRKQELTERANGATFLVYRADTPFNWQSVALEGSLREVPEEEVADHEAAMENAWRPDLLERATGERAVRVYEFRIEETHGVRHSGLAPGFEPDESE